MIDIRQMTYQVITILEDGTYLDISRAAEDLNWEEGADELSMRLSFTVQNAKYQGQYLSQLVKLGCIALVIADWGEDTAEVARGIIVDWDSNNSSSADTFTIRAYDELFYFQQSQDNRYIPAGTGTKAALTSMFHDWGIPIGEYKGPDISHAKTLFKNEFLSDIAIELLETAERQGAAKCILRASKGAVSILPVGSNEVVYHFEEGNSLTVVKDTIRTQNLVTRVKIVGKENTEGCQAVEAVLDGKTEYGIRQRMYTRQEDDTFAAAKAEAQKVIDEHGEPETNLSFQAPDVPVIRKGDKVHITTRARDGYFIIQSIQHHASNNTMTMDVVPTK